MNAKWVDFKELRSRLRFADLLKDYGVELKVKGDRATGFCPLPGHNGRRKSPSFSANLQRGIFQCFGCGAKGNVLDFAALMEGVDPADSHGVREVALRLQEKFLGGAKPSPPKRASATQAADKAAPRVTCQENENSEAKTKPSEISARSVIVNAPLDFSLQKLDVEHPYLKSRGLTGKTIAHFGLGYCCRGLMQGRIAIPLHDLQGQLVGYAGRLVDDTAISEDNPKYRFPGPREREGNVYEFRKSLLLYNAHRISRLVQDLIVVEGFTSVWWLSEHGFPNVVALMGANCSPEQAALIVDLTVPAGRIWLAPDGDEAGDRCSESVFHRVGPHRFCRWVKLDRGKQPTDCEAASLAVLLPNLAPVP